MINYPLLAIICKGLRWKESERFHRLSLVDNYQHLIKWHENIN
jgi:hypothetical protein